MSLIQRFVYRMLKPLNRWLTEKVEDLEECCEHKYLNGKSAIIKTETFDECRICGRSWQNETSFRNLYEAYYKKQL